MNRTIINNISKNISKNFVPIFHSAYSDNTMIINKNMMEYTNITEYIMSKIFIVDILIYKFIKDLILKDEINNF